MSSPDPLHLANSDKENTSTSHPVTSATATLSNKPPSSSKVTPASRTSTSTTRGRGRGRSTAGGATRKSAYAVPSSAAVTMYSSPRRSTRARSRSRSTSMSVSAGGSNALQQYLEQDEQDYNDDDGDDTYSIASSSATASRRSNANGERGASARADAKANGNQATTHDAANGTNINIDTSTIDAPGGWNGTTSSPPQSSSARKPTSRSTPKKQAQATDSHLHDLDRVEHDEDPAFRQQSVTQTSHQAMQQRGRGPSILQQSEQPSHASLKDTSVNIATAFRQAAGTKQLDIGANTGVTTLASQSLSTAATIASSSTTTYGNGQKAIASTSSIGFLARAGDREVPLVDTSSSRDKSDQPTSQSMQQNPSTSSSTTSQQQVTPGSAGKKRKARPSKGKAKDTAWKPSKDELANMSTDEYASEGAITTDPEDLTKYIENPWGKKVYKVEYEGNGRRIVRRRQRKKARGENGENDEEDEEEVDEDDEEEVLLDEEDIETNANATASPVTRRRNAATRRDRATAARGKSGRRAAVRSTRHTSVDGSVMSNDDTASQAPSQGGVSVTSYYLHEPAEAGPSSSRAQAQTSTAPTAQKPESQSAEQAGLVQTYSKAGNFQPYFAYSTTKVGNDTGNTSARHGYNSTAPLRARRDTTLSTSTEGANSNTPNQSYASRLLGGDSGRGGPSSTASFDQRGSDYDYAEEEKMTAALLAAKERGSLAKGIPEGRPILPDMLLTRNYGSHPSYRYNQLHLQTNSQKDREMSLSALSDQSSEVQSSQRAANHLEPKRAGYTGLKRAPAPPPRASSVVTESLQHAPGNYASFEASSSMSELNDQPVHEGESFAQRQAKKSLGRRLGEIMRAAFIALYWLIAGPLQWLKKQDANTIWKSAGAVLLAGLIIGSMYEQSPSPQTCFNSTSVWDRLPFLSSSSKRSSPSSTAPKALPSNFDEVVQRLISLEGSFRGLSDTASQQYTLSSEHTSLLRDSSKRLAGLEADFEAERRRSTKARDTNEKSRVAETEKLESTLKGIRNKLDSLNEAIKSHEAERKTGSVELSRLRSDLVKVYKDMDAHKGRLEMLVGKTDAALDRQRTVKVVREAIEDILPSRLAVNIDPKTGQVAVDPTFWRYLQSHFSSGGSGGAGSRGSVSWEDFVNSNSDKLRKMVNAEVDGHVTREVREGAILSKKTFAEALERELQALSQRISQSTSEQMAHLSSEVEGKLTKLSKSTGDSHKSIKLSSGQDVNALVSSMIEEALSRYSKDVLAKPDFALYTAGGRVIPSLTSPSYEIRPSSLTGSFLARLTGSGVVRGKAPVTALHPDISTGQCWAIGGTSGQLGVLLSRRIYPSDITVEHASKEVALDVSSAPKEFEAWGIVADPSDLKSIQGEEMRLVEGDDKIGNMIRLVQAAYDVEATNNIQTFEVDEKIKDLRIPISAVVFKILSNHGNEHLSCLYRVRVGGEVAEGR